MCEQKQTQVMSICQSDNFVQVAVGQIPVINGGDLSSREVDSIIQTLVPGFTQAVNFLRHGIEFCPAVQLLICGIVTDGIRGGLKEALVKLTASFSSPEENIYFGWEALIEIGREIVLVELWRELPEE